jgi:hypothetical protein
MATDRICNLSGIVNHYKEGYYLPNGAENDRLRHLRINFITDSMPFNLNPVLSSVTSSVINTIASKSNSKEIMRKTFTGSKFDENTLVQLFLIELNKPEHIILNESSEVITKEKIYEIIRHYIRLFKSKFYTTEKNHSDKVFVSSMENLLSTISRPEFRNSLKTLNFLEILYQAFFFEADWEVEQRLDHLNDNELTVIWNHGFNVASNSSGICDDNTFMLFQSNKRPDDFQQSAMTFTFSNLIDKVKNGRTLDLRLEDIGKFSVEYQMSTYLSRRAIHLEKYIKMNHSNLNLYGSRLRFELAINGDSELSFKITEKQLVAHGLTPNYEIIGTT